MIKEYVLPAVGVVVAVVVLFLFALYVAFRVMFGGNLD